MRCAILTPYRRPPRVRSSWGFAGSSFRSTIFYGGVLDKMMGDQDLRLRAVLDEMHPYHPPRMREEISVDRGSTKFVKLTMNELSFGPLPEAREAVVESLSRAGRYPDRDSDPLREAIADANPGIAPDNVVVGNGTSEVLVDLMQVLERPGEVIIPWPSFPFYVSAASVVGLETRKVGLDEHHRADLEAMLSAVSGET